MTRRRAEADDLTPVMRERFAAQLLSGEPARTAEAVAERLLAIQGQDLRGARLAIRARSHLVAASEVDRALTETRSLLITWLNRGTLHLVRREDYFWLHPLTTPQLRTGNARRLQQLGLLDGDVERGTAVIRRELELHGPRTRTQLAEAVGAAGIRTDDQALIHLLFRSSLDGVVVRGPMVGRQHAYVLTADWLGTSAVPAREASVRELARRYLRGHGPASDRDLAKWAGITLGDARRALQDIEGEIAEEAGLVRLRSAERTIDGTPPPKLLGVFDPVLHGWTSRQAVLGAHEPVIATGGMFRQFALACGRCVGDWAWVNRRATLRMLEPVAAPIRAALEADAAAVDRFLTT